VCEHDILISSSAAPERTCCRVDQFWPTMEDYILQTL